MAGSCKRFVLGSLVLLLSFAYVECHGDGECYLAFLEPYVMSSFLAYFRAWNWSLIF